MVCITSTLTLAILPQLNKKLKLKREKSYLYSVKQQKRIPFMISLFFFSRKSHAAGPVSNFVCTSYFKRDTLGWIIYLFFNYFCCPSWCSYSMLLFLSTHYCTATYNLLLVQSTAKHLMAKVGMDQAIFAPVALSSFYIGLSLLEGQDRQGVYTEWRTKFPHTWAVSYTLNSLSKFHQLKSFC